MEVPQQQRRSETGNALDTEGAVTQLATALTAAKLPFEALDLLDTLWLAQFYEPGVAMGGANSGTASGKGDPTGNASSKEPFDQGTYDLYAPEGNADEAAEDNPDTAFDSAEDTTTEDAKGMPFPVPGAPALRTQLPLARALRPLMRKVPSHQRFDLDEEATVTRIAETLVWMPVVRARPERWLELDLVVEDSKTTAIWARSIAELVHLAEYQGAFRTVRTWRLAAEALPASDSAPGSEPVSQSGEVRLWPRWQLDGGRKSASNSAAPHLAVGERSRSPRELVDPTGRRLIWLVSDCTSLLWRQPSIYQTLADWSQQQSVSIFHMFPERLWSRTALRNGYVVALGATTPGAASAKLSVTGLPRRLQKRGGQKLATVPVLTVEPAMLQQWARVVAGAGEQRTVGRTFDLVAMEKRAQQPTVPPTHAAKPERTAVARVALFRATASTTVRQLANLIAAVPVSLPVIDLLRAEFSESFDQPVTQAHVAEVLMSGLLRRVDTDADDACRYIFVGDGLREPSQRVRDLLLGDASIKTTRQVLDVLSRAICDKLGIPGRGFEALLLQTGDATLENAKLRSTALPFASIGVDVLRRLGGEHAELARRVDLSDWGAGGDGVDDFPSLEEFEFNAVEFREASEFPPLSTETFTFLTLEWQAPEVQTRQPLASFDITVATLEKISGQWQVQHEQRQARRFVERLPEDVGLEMVTMPGGSFVMGSPKEEPERYNDESPQHEVTLEPFFMGRYPVTQAQWRIVAGMPKVACELDPEPSNFKGALLPVEQVSWYEAIEFCARLSAHTGREYCLPTEAQWEYACRAGTTTPFSFGDMISTEMANYDGSAYAKGPTGESRGKTTPVDHFGFANAYGLSDMHGNVDEWCQDHWHENYADAPTDGSAWLTEDEEASRVRRGGSWYDYPRYCRSAYRHGLTPGYRFNRLGFRVSCVAPRALA